MHFVVSWFQVRERLFIAAITSVIKITFLQMFYNINFKNKWIKIIVSFFSKYQIVIVGKLLQYKSHKRLAVIGKKINFPSGRTTVVDYFPTAEHP